jgi:predicted flap endonuclease-1-like 5' DNA nuclease
VAVAAAALMAEEEHEAAEAAKAAPQDQMPDTAEDAQAVAAAIKLHDDGATDDMTRIKGVGPKLAELLSSMGISRYDQIAAWSDADVLEIDAKMGRFSGRIERDDWRTQARYLASGDTAGYEEKFGKL